MSDNDSSDYARLKAAFLDLLERDAPARTARLAQLDAESPMLAAALRRQLLAIGQSLPLLDRSDAPTRLPQVAGYRVLRELGRGGMGVVWLAERGIDDACQIVALKQIAHSHWDADELRRFQRERRILARLDHPCIAALIDAGRDADGNAFLATQYVDGERLDRWLASQQPVLRQRIELMRQIVSAVSYAHRQLVVHRDLKPANILINRDRMPKLLDFGIARALQEDAATRDGPSQMTLRYAAPEQVSSDGADAGTGVDVYALGVLLFEMLANGSPYGAASGPSALLHAILHEEPGKPSQSRSAVPGVDADLDAICRKALRKRPQDRYASAHELLTDLDRWLAGEPVEARSGERGYRLRRKLRQHWPWLAAACLALAAVGFHLHALRQQLTLAEHQRDKAQALADHFGRLFAEARPAETESGEISARTLLERSVESLLTDRERPPNVRAALLLASANALNYLGQMQSAGRAAREANRLALNLVPGDPDLLASTHSELATVLSKTGDNAGAQREAAAGIALFERGLAHQRGRQRTLEQQVAMFAEQAGDRAGARAAYQRIADSTRAHLQVKDELESYLSAQTNLATGDMASNPPAAETRLREALQMARRHDFHDDATLLPMRTYLTMSLYNQRKIAAARDMMTSILPDARAFYGAQEPWLGLIINVAGNLAAFDGDYGQADALLAESGQLTSDNYGPDHPNTRASQAARAVVSVLSEDWPEAVTRLDAILGWLHRNDMADSDLGQYLQAARAYVQARRDPNAANVAHARELLQKRSGWSDAKLRWIGDDWAAWLDSAQPRQDIASDD